MKEFFINKIGTVENHWNTSIVSSITIVEHDKDVYNLEVEEDNTYLVDNVVVHNCRTRRIATPKGWEPTGDKASVGSKAGGKDNFEKRKKRRDGKVVKYQGRKDKAFKGEAISAQISRDDWLRGESVWFVQDSLGKERANLFLNKGYSLSSFSDMTGRPLTLDEIVKREG